MTGSNVQSKSERAIPKNYCVGQELNWNAPWVDVSLWVELPFWLMVNNSVVDVEVEGHSFSVALHDNYFELYGGSINDSRFSVAYMGPHKTFEHLSESIQKIRKEKPDLPFMWRKCKTVLKIKTRCNDFSKQIAAPATPGELDLMDALNFVERGNYSDAIRRITTAIEVLVEHLVGKALEAAEGKEACERFLKRTKNKFNERIAKYEEITKRKLTESSRRDLIATRKLRNLIVHDGYCISPSERGLAHRQIDTGRWLFNWFENDERRRKIREGRVAFRSLGLDRTYGIFPSKITSEGVVVSPPPSLQKFTQKIT